MTNIINTNNFMSPAFACLQKVSMSTLRAPPVSRALKLLENTFQTFPLMSSAL